MGESIASRKRLPERHFSVLARAASGLGIASPEFMEAAATRMFHANTKSALITVAAAHETPGFPACIDDIAHGPEHNTRKTLLKVDAAIPGPTCAMHCNVASSIEAPWLVEDSPVGLDEGHVAAPTEIDSDEEQQTLSDATDLSSSPTTKPGHILFADSQIRRPRRPRWLSGVLRRQLHMPCVKGNSRSRSRLQARHDFHSKQVQTSALAQGQRMAVQCATAREGMAAAATKLTK